MYAVLAQNDESQWRDETGTAYHFPKRYAKLIPTGTTVIFYKGRLKNKKFDGMRLSREPHYFAVATIGKIYNDSASAKGDLFALIDDYSPFKEPVLAKQLGAFLESIPKNRETNYWRDGVRFLSQTTYDTILNLAILVPQETSAVTPNFFNDVEQTLESIEDGNAAIRYTTVYERNPRLRQQALLIHGTTCKACGFNFKKFYGEYAGNYIHIHHIRPVCAGPAMVDPEKDLVPLCANCHAVAHRRKDRVLTVDEIRIMIRENILTKGIAG